MEEAYASNSRDTMRNSLEKLCLSEAAEAIAHIPEQLSSVVQNKAKSLAENVKTDLNLVQTAIHRSGGDEDIVEFSIGQLKKIPEIVRSSFDSKLVAMEEVIRLKLSTIIQMVKSNTPESREMYHRVVRELWTIPEKLDQITGEAVDQAVQESKREAIRHCDHVLSILPHDAGVSRRALTDAKLHIVEAVNDMHSETMRSLRRTTTANVKHAVAHVDDPREVPATTLTACVRVREHADPLPQTDGPSTSQSSHSAAGIEDPSAPAGEEAPAAPAGLHASARGARHNNAGSMGHPEMCVRPCLYFLRGECANGGGCKFCHCEHPVRPVHLGRRHRKTLGAATTAECFGILLPIIETKMTMLSLATDTLKAYASQQCAPPDQAAAGSQLKPRELRTLERALGALSMRVLIDALQRKVGAQASREKSLVDALLLELRGAGFLVDTGEGAQEEAQEDA
ncbi:unnamed protein product [Prorocentrum cordatum]|uniref:C3H1-type domain-containing protein n=1 Tax=Prorocentrum cordatum TaxID=2364126 RepID=A0ABN9UAM1_9DINO|nr:unnamed protein product [Polarella glacialis]